jgi:hypothetical protein
MIPNVRFEIMFDIAPKPTDSEDLTPPTPLACQGIGENSSPLKSRKETGERSTEE